ncbi:fibronectin type III-like domain-contianing protein [Streptomyces coeruleorubidus]|uniref:fibronectin type III-like domain-contianing protein n=1 Tax=Streptomyces coeruleorubidus TaxID=116188 RepID=UPI00340D80A6
MPTSSVPRRPPRPRPSRRQPTTSRSRRAGLRAASALSRLTCPEVGSGLSLGHAPPGPRWTADGLGVAFTVRNTGPRDGVDVPQAYAGPSPACRSTSRSACRPGTGGSPGGPGEQRRVTVRVEPRTLSSWDPKAHDWVLGTGPRDLWIGASSRDLRLRTSARVGG